MDRIDAEEYTQSLGQIIAGSWRQIHWAKKQGIPEALGLEVDEWVEMYLGGYIRLSIPERREAVAELASEGMSTREIGEVLGVNHSTVVRDIRGANAPTEDDTQEGSINPNGANAPTEDDTQEGVGEPEQPETVSFETAEEPETVSFETAEEPEPEPEPEEEWDLRNIMESQPLSRAEEVKQELRAKADEEQAEADYQGKLRRAQSRLRQLIIGWLELEHLPSDPDRDAILDGLFLEEREKVEKYEKIYKEGAKKCSESTK